MGKVKTNVSVTLTKEELKDAFNQFIDLMYEVKGNVEVPKRLVKSSKVSELVNIPVDIRPSVNPTTHLESKKLLMSKKGQKGYEVDVDVLRDMYEEFVGLSDYGTLKDPKKAREVMEAILAYNSNTVTGYGRVTEPQVHALDAVGEVLGMDTLEFLTDAE